MLSPATIFNIGEAVKQMELSFTAGERRYTRYDLHTRKRVQPVIIAAVKTVAYN
jgi:hypothetical protein